MHAALDQSPQFAERAGARQCIGSQRGERERVGRVVRKVESALKAEGGIARILESRQTGANEPGNLIRRGRLLL